MTRDTSLSALASIKPTLSDRQAVVYGLLERSHALTNSEIARELGWGINRVTPRCLELRNMGLVQAYGKRQCRVTGRTAYAWGVAKGAPVLQGPKPKMVMMSVVIDGVRMVREVPEQN